jgi:amidophosphoribosyltransferase
VGEGALFQTTVDTEVIVHLIARSRAADGRRADPDALSQLTGAFSVIITVGDTLYARAIRGASGRSSSAGSTAAATSSPARRAHSTWSVPRSSARSRPGEIIRIRGGGVRRCPARRRGASGALHLRAGLLRAARLAHLGPAWTARAARSAASSRANSRRTPTASSACPTRRTPRRSATRRRAASRYELGLIRNHYVGRTFIHPTQEGRDFRVRIKYNAVREVIDGKRVIVVDDSLVRGTTSRGLIALIREAGAREVHFRVSSPPVTNPCYYGIDMPTKEELIGAQKTVEEIRSTSTSTRSATSRWKACTAPSPSTAPSATPASPATTRRRWSTCRWAAA